MKCPYENCEAENPNDAQYCHLCGRPIHKQNPLKWLIWVGVIIAVIIGAGVFSLYIAKNNQAKAEGLDVANIFNECQNKFINKTRNDRDHFVNSFDCKIYKTRENAINSLEKILYYDKECYEHELKKAKSAYNKISAYYENNYRRKQLFDNSFHASLENQINPDEVIEIAISDESFQSCLTCLLPMKPDVEQVRRDLKGHTLKGASENPFFSDSWRLVINESNLERVDINSQSYKDDKWTLLLLMTVREGGHNLSVRAQAIYELGQSKESWKLVDVITDEVSIVRTSTYLNAVDVSYEWYGDIVITNKNESPLLIGIEVWIDEVEGWLLQKLRLEVDKKTTISCGTREDGRIPYRILFVEKA